MVAVNADENRPVDPSAPAECHGALRSTGDYCPECGAYNPGPL